jgi:methylated-DNA-protein-cysteine methyltransferase related protein
VRLSVQRAWWIASRRALGVNTVVPGTSTDTYARIYAVVRRIPRGCVATYGQIARLAGLPRHARMVGYALHNLPADSGVPWHRVVNAQGRISLRTGGDWGDVQEGLLRSEGVELCGGRINLRRFRWSPTQGHHPG